MALAAPSALATSIFALASASFTWFSAFRALWMAVFFASIISVSEPGGVILLVNSSTMKPSAISERSRRALTSRSKLARFDISESLVYWLAQVR